MHKPDTYRVVTGEGDVYVQASSEVVAVRVVIGGNATLNYESITAAAPAWLVRDNSGRQVAYVFLWNY